CRHRIEPMRATRPAAHDAEEPHPTTGPKPVSGDSFIGIFRTGGEMAAMVANEARECELVEAHQASAEQAPGRPLPRPLPVACLARDADSLRQLRPPSSSRSALCNPRLHRRSAWLRHAVPYSRAPAPDT